MKRRTFIAALGGAAVWPVVARGQQPERMRPIGVIMNVGADDPDGRERLATFHGAGSLKKRVGGTNAKRFKLGS